MSRWVLLTFTIAVFAAAFGHGRVARGAVAPGEFLLIFLLGSLVGAALIVAPQGWVRQRRQRRRAPTRRMSEHAG
jgi:hypothetical protein